MGRKFCVGGNWKLNGDKASITELCKVLTTGPLNADTEVVVGCPAPYLTLARSQLPDTVGVAAQVSMPHAQNGAEGGAEVRGS